MHEWPTTTPEAEAIQEQLCHQVIIADDYGEVQTVAGVDVGFEEQNTIARAAVVVLSYPALQPLDQAIARRRVTFPYIPGFLSFRETPVVLDALTLLQTRPDLLICDGQGIAHPRRFGIACHLGLLSGIPSVGCAKSRLIGQHGQVPDERGAMLPLMHQNEHIGIVLRSRPRTKPLYVSPGHRVSLAQAVRFVMNCVTKYRLPETTRAAHNLASRRT
jgi:deoxyribonuclease V